MTRPLLALTVLGTILAACGGAGASTAPTQASTAVQPSATPASVAPSPASTRIEVQLTDALRIEPAAMTVRAGMPVTFVVTNVGVLDHEFYLGDEAAQQDHAQEMAAMGGMAHDEPEGIGVSPGQTKELTYTFAEPGKSLAGCHTQGHYLAGMKAVITIE